MKITAVGSQLKVRLYLYVFMYFLLLLYPLFTTRRRNAADFLDLLP